MHALPLPRHGNAHLTSPWPRSSSTADAAPPRRSSTTYSADNGHQFCFAFCFRYTYFSPYMKPGEVAFIFSSYEKNRWRVECGIQWNEEIPSVPFLLFFVGIEPATTAGAPFWVRVSCTSRIIKPLVSKQSWFAGHAVQMPSTSRGSAVLSLVRRRFIGMVKVSFGMLFDFVALSSKHMLQVRCSPWG